MIRSTRSMVLRPLEGRNINVQIFLRNLSTSIDSTSGNDRSVANANSNNDAHNRSLVQMRDYESFLIGLLHPQHIQSDYFALRAFHVELASIQAKESSVASMRMSWWLDVIHSLYDTGKNNNAGQISQSESAGAAFNGNPTVAGLKTAIESHKLTKRFFERMVETRINDVERTSNGQFNDVKDMIHFFERTNSTFLFLDLECCGIIDEKADAVANSVGIATGIVNSIRSIGYGNVGIPHDLMVKYDIRQNDITDPRSLISASSDGDIDGDDENTNTNTGSDDNSDLERRKAMQNAVRDMAIVAGKYLQHARKHQAHVPKEGKSAMLPAVSALRYLERLESTNYDVMEEKIRDVENMESLNGRLWRLGQMMYLGRAWLTGVF